MLWVTKMRIEVIALLSVIALFLAYSLQASPTGFVVGGGTQGAGEQQKGNPNYGVIKGFLTLVIRDSNNVVINTETPATSYHVYFVPQNEQVNWTATISCDTNIAGTLANVDADDSGNTCAQVNYATPTAKSCSATSTNGTAMTIYRAPTDTTAGNQGCFGAKLPAGNYDIYT